MCEVASEAKRIAKKFETNEHNAFVARCLHDIGAIIPNTEEIDVCNQFEIIMLPEGTNNTNIFTFTIGR
ncbi:MAG TPA: hypothetical protein VGL27_11685 [Negativicutes bacterium]|jgi:HD superfamily phosphohydrolase YqeK